jgi:TolB-like protein
MTMVETPELRSYAFESFTLDLRRGCLRNGDRELALRPKSFAVLQHLVENAGRLLSKDELLNALWPNVIATEASLARCVSDIRLVLQDSDQRIIKTVTGRGYVFAAPVSLHSGVDGGVPPTPDRSAPAPRMSIVVLPFTNLGPEDQSYLVEGITEDLTTDLSRIPGTFVISSNTSSTYRHKAVDSRRVGRELGVRYVLEGSIQSGATSVRVNAQLIDAETGAHLWADRFDKPRSDIFELQDEIIGTLARTIGIELLDATGRRAQIERPNNMVSLDLTLRGRAMLQRSRPIYVEARKLFEEALRLDDRNAVALNGLATTHAYEVLNLLADDPVGQTRIAEAAVMKSLALVPDNAYSHFAYSLVLSAQCAPKRALRETEIAIDLDSNLADAYAYTGLIKLHLGRAEETESAVYEAMRRSPRDPMMANWHFWTGAAELYLSRIDRALERLRKSTLINPNLGYAWCFLASALAIAGSKNEAKEACAVVRHLMPGMTLAKFRAHGERLSDNPIFLTQRQHIVEGMRVAGIPE